MAKWGCMLVICFIFSSLEAQKMLRLGVLPRLNISKKLPRDYRLNFKTESRIKLAEGAFSTPLEIRPDLSTTDLSIFLGKKLGVNNALALGYLMRLRDGQVHTRFTQQFTYVAKFAAFRLAQRIVTDQTLQQRKAAQYRFRYRVATDFSLNGQEVDPGEFYVKFSNEYLNAFQSNEYDLEIRLVPSFGYAITDNNKLEWGIDYRWSSFIQGTGAHHFWLTLSWYKGW